MQHFPTWQVCQRVLYVNVSYMQCVLTSEDCLKNLYGMYNLRFTEPYPLLQRTLQYVAWNKKYAEIILKLFLYESLISFSIFFKRESVKTSKPQNFTVANTILGIHSIWYIIVHVHCT